MAKITLNENAMALATGTISAVYMLLLGIGWNIGVYVGAAEQMAKWHLFFNPSILGIIGGIIEVAIQGAILGYLLVWAYNKFN